MPRHRLHVHEFRAVSDDNGSMNQAKKKGSFSMGAIVLLVGVIGLGAMVAVVTVLAVTRSRRNSGGNGAVSGPYSQNMGYPPQQQMPPTQLPYSAPAPNQGYGYPAPDGQPPQQPNPYAQQPPYQGQ